MQNPPPARRPGWVSRADANRYGTTVGLLKTQLATVAGPRLASATAINYPATPLSWRTGPGELIVDLGASERKGVTALVTAINRSYRNGCAARPVLLTGYSQGAEVVIRAVNRLSPREQAGVSVALLGNPSYRPNQPGDFPGGTPATGVRPALQHDAYRLPAGVRARTIDICAPGDAICGVDPTRSSFLDKINYVLTHTGVHSEAYAFGRRGYVQRAARFLWAHRTG
jgi:hypothetical protein